MIVALLKQAFPTLLGLVFLVGCDGGGSTASSGATQGSTVRVTVQWPAKSRAIQTDANSVRIVLSVNGTEIDHTTLDRPLGNAGASEIDSTFNDVPAGALTTSVTAFTQAQCQGAALGTSEASASLLPGATVVQKAVLTISDGGIVVTTLGTGTIAVGVH